MQLYSRVQDAVGARPGHTARSARDCQAIRHPQRARVATLSVGEPARVDKLAGTVLISSCGVSMNVMGACLVSRHGISCTTAKLATVPGQRQGPVSAEHPRVIV